MASACWNHPVLDEEPVRVRRSISAIAAVESSIMASVRPSLLRLAVAWRWCRILAGKVGGASCADRLGLGGEARLYFWPCTCGAARWPSRRPSDAARPPPSRRSPRWILVFCARGLDHLQSRRQWRSAATRARCRAVLGAGDPPVPEAWSIWAATVKGFRRRGSRRILKTTLVCAIGLEDLPRGASASSPRLRTRPRRWCRPCVRRAPSPLVREATRAGPSSQSNHFAVVERGR